MRMYSVSKMYANFIYKCILIYFKKDILQTDLQGKQKIHAQSYWSL